MFANFQFIVTALGQFIYWPGMTFDLWQEINMPRPFCIGADFSGKFHKMMPREELALLSGADQLVLYEGVYALATGGQPSDQLTAQVHDILAPILVKHLMDIVIPDVGIAEQAKRMTITLVLEVASSGA